MFWEALHNPERTVESFRNGGLLSELTMTKVMWKGMMTMMMTMTSAFSQRAFAGPDSFGAGTAFVSTGQGVFTSI